MDPPGQPWGDVFHAPHMLAREGLQRQWLDTGLHRCATIGDLLLEGVRDHPSTKMIFVSQDRPGAELTIADVYSDALRAARGLRRLGLRRGDVLVLQVPNWAEGMISVLAAFLAGIIVVPLIHMCAAAELGFILRQTKAKALVIPRRWRGIDFEARLHECGELPDVESIILVDDGDVPPPFVRWADLFENASDLNLSDPPDSTDICMINFTSGTTSSPKGAMHSHRAICSEIASVPMIDPGVDGYTFWPTPAGHIGSIISYLRPFLVGENSIYLDQIDPAMVVETMSRYSVRQSGGATFHLRLFLESVPKPLLHRLRHFVAGMTSVPFELAALADDNGFAATRCYGLTEHPTVTGCSPDAPLEARARTDGRPTAGNLVRIVDGDGRDLPPGDIGEIVTMGPELMIGYLDAELNRQAFDEAGWFRTGDLGVLDDEGYLTIVDRKKDIIIRGGENISSREVEELLCRHPAVVEAAAVGVADERLGERVGVFLRIADGFHFNLDMASAHFEALGVMRQKTPEVMRFVDDFPRTAVGKINKVALKGLLNNN